jgi:heat shock protein beta
LEINPRHPLIKELLRRVETDKSDETARQMANLLYETATLRSGYMLKDTASFAQRVELIMRNTMGITDSKVDEEDDEDTETESLEKDDEEDADDKEDHDEL